MLFHCILLADKGRGLSETQKNSFSKPFDPIIGIYFTGNKERRRIMASCPRKKKPLNRSSSMSHAKEAELQKAFSLVDTDGTGRITEEEFYQMYRNQGKPTANS